MFARSKKQNDDTTQIPKDVADLIDEIDKVAAPFDESEMKEDEDALLVDGTDASLFDSNAVWASPPQEKHIHSPDLSGLSDISASLDDLAFLGEEIKKHIKEETHHHDDSVAKSKDSSMANASQESDTFDIKASRQDDTEALSLDDNEVHDSKSAATNEPAAPAAEKSSVLSKMRSSISRANNSNLQDETPVCNAVEQTINITTKGSAHDEVSATTTKEKDADKSDEEDNFNFVNIGNRLLDDSQDAPSASQEYGPSSNSTDTKTIITYKKVAIMVGKCLFFFLKATLQSIGLCARNLKVTSLALLVCTLSIYLKWYMPFSITVSVQPSAFNASLMDDLFPPPPQVEDLVVINETLSKPVLETTVGDFLVMMKVMVLFMTVGLTGYSVLGMTSSSAIKNDEVVTYTKHEDDCSRYNNLSLKELKAALRSRNLCTTGIHSHLVDRLVAHDSGHGSTNVAVTADIDVKVVSRNVTLKTLQRKLRTRNLTVTGLKDDLISKVWIPARSEELDVLPMDDLRGMLEGNKLSSHGKSRDDLIRRLIEAGH
eukprot:CAMPEP_0202499702 /NCGR_PEP_ID=MMETSP1361-20130828/30594_1 /ASSEMBLY_ACC=CAM_ASM_000849 /TAXON_ID=210615 /ORGANISM="Staurosira complex sp., Strain CCMP2646" /LENGTH=543 /DNA_ID=CAMNT_0049131955 /DNA_START=148 /DNA_END=1779 /DNA_ORIENTATION=+